MAPRELAERPWGVDDGRLWGPCVEVKPGPVDALLERRGRLVWHGSSHGESGRRIRPRDLRLGKAVLVW